MVDTKRRRRRRRRREKERDSRLNEKNWEERWFALVYTKGATRRFSRVIRRRSCWVLCTAFAFEFINLFSVGAHTDTQVLVVLQYIYHCHSNRVASWVEKKATREKARKIIKMWNLYTPSEVRSWSHLPPFFLFSSFLFFSYPGWILDRTKQGGRGRELEYNKLTLVDGARSNSNSSSERSTTVSYDPGNHQLVKHDVTRLPPRDFPFVLST